MDTTDDSKSSNSSTPMDVDEIHGHPHGNVHAVSDNEDNTTNTNNNNTNNNNTNTNNSNSMDGHQSLEMLRGEDLPERISAANQLESIAKSLGDERTRNELLPYLSDGVDDEDEVLAAVAVSLSKLVHHVGGPSYVHTLLVPLEILLSVEEATVRTNAQNSATIISNFLPPDHFHTKYTAMLTRLAKQEWFTARISASILLSSSFDHANFGQSPLNSNTNTEQREAHATLFASLCRDDVPMVRRAASKELGNMVLKICHTMGLSSVTTNGILSTTFLSLYEELAGSDQPDSVRLHTTENCIAFGKGVTYILSSQQQEASDHDSLSLQAASVLVKKIVPLLAATIEDRSWRVRWTAASKFADVIDAYKELEGTMDALIPAYERLLQDPEAEVKTAATLNLAKVAKCGCTVLPAPLSSEISGGDGDGDKSNNNNNNNNNNNTPRISAAKRLVKKVNALTEDDNENVRAALAMVATDLAPMLGKEATISDLVPQVLLLLRDTTSEVRLNVISSLGSLNQVIGVDLLSQSLLPAILDLASDSKWRIRLAIMQHIPLLAKQLGKEFFSEQLVNLCVGWLGDSISSIRQAAAENLKELTNIFGAEWAIEYLIPPLGDIRNHPSYLRRLIAVQAFVSMSTVMDPELSITEVLPIVLVMATDSVANIRFNVAKGLKTMAPICGLAVTESQIRPILKVLADDTDRDVRFFANQTIQALDAVGVGVGVGVNVGVAMGVSVSVGKD